MRHTAWMNMVAEFHQNIGSPAPRRLADEPGYAMDLPGHNPELSIIAHDLADIETRLEQLWNTNREDRRAFRAKLIIGEVSELVAALATKDEVELADAIADTHYVLTGTSLTYDIPEGAVFAEVHRSNMTKHTAQDAVANHTGDKGKGETYSPPNIAAAIEYGRNDKEHWTTQLGRMND